LFKSFCPLETDTVSKSFDHEFSQFFLKVSRPRERAERRV